MKIAVIVVVILGALASFSLGVTWLSDFNEYKTELAAANETSAEISSDPELSKALRDVETLRNCAYALIVCAIIALVAVFLMRRIGKIAAVIIVATGIVPAFFSPTSLLFTSLLVIGGILAFFVKPKAQAVNVSSN